MKVLFSIYVLTKKALSHKKCVCKNFNAIDPWSPSSDIHVNGVVKDKLLFLEQCSSSLTVIHYNSIVNFHKSVTYKIFCFTQWAKNDIFVHLFSC